MFAEETTVLCGICGICAMFLDIKCIIVREISVIVE